MGMGSIHCLIVYVTIVMYMLNFDVDTHATALCKKGFRPTSANSLKNAFNINSKYKLQINIFEISLQKKIEICYTVNNNFVAIFSFLTPNQVAFNFPHPCAPYIYGLPEIMRRSFNILFEQLGVRDTFEAQDFVDTLRQMHEEYRERELDRYNDMCYHQSETVMFAIEGLLILLSTSPVEIAEPILAAATFKQLQTCNRN